MSPCIPQVHLPSPALLLAFTATPIKRICTKVVNCWGETEPRMPEWAESWKFPLKGWEDKGPWILWTAETILTFFLASISFFAESCKLLIVLFLVRTRSFRSTNVNLFTLQQPDFPGLPSPAPLKPGTLTPGMRISHPNFCQDKLCPSTQLCSCPSPGLWVGNCHPGQDWYW